MSGRKILTMDNVRAERCDAEIATVLDKYQCDLITEQRVINGICVGIQIYSVPRKPQAQG